jgi:hypothetical protein
MFKKTLSWVACFVAGGLLVTSFQNCGGGMASIESTLPALATSASTTPPTQASAASAAANNTSVQNLMTQIEAEAAVILANTNINISSLSSAVSSLSFLLQELQILQISDLPIETLLARTHLISTLQSEIARIQPQLVNLLNPPSMPASGAAATHCDMSQANKINILTQNLTDEAFVTSHVHSLYFSTTAITTAGCQTLCEGLKVAGRCSFASGYPSAGVYSCSFISDLSVTVQTLSNFGLFQATSGTCQ